MSVAKRGTINAMNGPGREELAEAIKRHREQRYSSRQEMSDAIAEMTDGQERLSVGTIKNAESKDQAVTAKTLRLLDLGLGWEPGTAQAVLMGRRPAPAQELAANGPGRGKTSGGLSRRLEAEYEGQEILDVRAVDVSGTDARVVLTLVGGADLDTAAIRRALLELDAFERHLRHEDDDRSG